MAAAGRESPISGQPVRDPPRRPPRDGNGCRPGPVSVRDGGETSGVPAAAARSWPQAQPAARGEPRSPDPGSGGARPERRSLGSEPGGAGPAPDARFRGWALLVGPKNRVRVEPEPVCGRCRRPVTPTLPASRGGNGAGGEGSPAFPLGVSVDFVLRGRKATGEFCRKMAGLAPSPQPRTSPSPSNVAPPPAAASQGLVLTHPAPSPSGPTHRPTRGFAGCQQAHLAPRAHPSVFFSIFRLRRLCVPEFFFSI